MIPDLPPLSDLAVLTFAALVAGTVRGFSGFGTAMIFLPMAALVLGPVQAIIALVVMDLVGPLPALPAAARVAHWTDLRRLMTGVILALPVGVLTLFLMSPDVFRWLVSIIALVMLAGLIFGWRHTGRLSRRHVFATGLGGGFLGGVAGIPGPPVIFVYMASPHPAAVIRANITFYLLFYDWIMLSVLGVMGRLDGQAIVIGLMLIVPNMIGNYAGTKLFKPGQERLYRTAAYLIIGASAIAGLPFLGFGE